MEERQPEKRNDRHNRNNRHRNRNRGNRDQRQGGGPREPREASAKPDEVMAYVDELDAPPLVVDTTETGTNTTEVSQSEPTGPRPEANRQNNDRRRDNNQRQDRSNREGSSRHEANRPDAERTDTPRPETNGRADNKSQANGRDRDKDRNREENRDRNRNDSDRERGRDRDRNREFDRETERPAQLESVAAQEFDREDELRPSDPRPGESRLGEMRIRDLAGRGADVAPDERIVVGITLGDYNGVGPEVILKALKYNQLQRICTPVIYGSMRVLNRYRNLLNLKDWNLNGIQHVGQASHKMTNVITCWNDTARPAPAPTPAAQPEPVPNSDIQPSAQTETESNDQDEAKAAVEEMKPVVQAEATPQPAPVVHEIQPGKVTSEAGQAALACLERAVEDLKAGKIDALITGPINKHNIQSETFKFPGHTEYLAQAFGVPDNLMFMVGETLRVGVVTGHVPLGRVRQNVTRNAINQKLTMMMQSLRVDFGIDKPRIAVLGLNPHAGENGLLGNEEQETIIPVIDEWRKKGELVFGPFSADGFFGTRGYRKYDGILAMYHDQGLIPFKAIAFDEGVNFTAGLPIVRSSPDHGTAYDIAGKNLADETSMIQAIYLACDVARRRKEYQETQENALKK